MTDPIYSHFDKVRDHEVDYAQGVSNARYLEYLQVGRHEWLRSVGIDLAEAVPVVMRVEIDYQKFLTLKDEYRVDIVAVRRDRRNYFIESKIVHLATGKVSVASVTTIVFFTPSRRIVKDNILDLLE